MKTRERIRPEENGLFQNIKDYIKLQIDLLKINLTEKSSQILSVILSLLIGVILLLVAFIYFSMALVHWMASLLNSMIYGYLIVGGIFVILFLVFYLLRKKIFLNPLIKKISSILFDRNKKS